MQQRAFSLAAAALVAGICGWVGSAWFAHHPELPRVIAALAGGRPQPDAGWLDVLSSAGGWAELGTRLALPLTVLAAQGLFGLWWRSGRKRAATVELRIRPVSAIAALPVLAFALLLWRARHVMLLDRSLMLASPLDVGPFLWSFVARLGPALVTLAAVGLAALALGRALFERFGLQGSRPERLLFSLALGLLALHGLLFALAMPGLLCTSTVWALLAAVPLALYRSTRVCVGELAAPATLRVAPLSLETSAGLLLILLTVLGLLDLVRPLPTGYDAMGAYVNHARQAAIEGDFRLFGMQAWVLVTSAGFAMWGTQPAGPGATATILLSWGGSVLATLAVISFAARFLTARVGCIAALVLASSPMMVWLTELDTKVDLTLLYVTVMATWAMLRWLKGGPRAWAVVAGALFGFAFAIKVTSVMVAAGAAAAALLWIALDRARDPKSVLAGALAAALAGVAVVAPWLIENAAEVGIGLGDGAARWSTLSTWIDGAAEPPLDWAAVGVDPESDCDPPTSRPEEIERYFGDDRGDGLAAYLRLPWKVAMNTPVQGVFVVVSFLLLAAPLAALALWMLCRLGLPASTGGTLSAGFAALAALIAGALAAAITTQTALLVIASAIAGGAVGLAGWHARPRDGAPADASDDVLGLLLVSGAVAGVIWAFTSEGIPWYGLWSLFVAAVLAGTLAEWCARAGVAASAAFALALLVATAPAWALRVERTHAPRGGLYGGWAAAGAQYAAGYISAAQYRDAIQGGEVEIARVLEGSPRRVYRVGSTVEYLIDGARDRVYRDPQLDAWACLNHEGDGERTLGRLLRLGFGYIVFDTSTPAIEADPGGTLHRKVRRFTRWTRAHTRSVSRDRRLGVELFELPD